MNDDQKKKSGADGNKNSTSSGGSKPNVFSLENSEPSSNPITLSALGRSSATDKKIKNSTKAVLPGAVADTVVPDKNFKGNKYLRKKAASSINSSATGYKQSSNESATNKASSSLTGNFVNSKVVASTSPSLENSESSGFPDFLPDFIAISHSSNTSNGQQLSDAEAHNEASSPESEHMLVETSQDNARYISEGNPFITDTQGLVVATLVESGVDVIVDAIVVDDTPTAWYKDRQTLLIIGFFVIIAVAVSVFATVLLLGEKMMNQRGLLP